MALAERPAVRFHLVAVEGAGRHGNGFAADDLEVELDHVLAPLGEMDGIAGCPLFAEDIFADEELVGTKAGAVRAFDEVAEQVGDEGAVVVNDTVLGDFADGIDEPPPLDARQQVGRAGRHSGRRRGKSGR
ncbi:MAG: hypothetical protein IPH73_04810 [Rhodocyclales bacterium]|nr:hypothetical protein [Rhodocyclales bacterium]